jgi:predicted nucleic acid-binding protein
VALVIALDATVLIPLFDPANEWHDRSRALVARHIAEGFGISVLTLAEALVHQVSVGTAERAVELVEAMGVKTFPVAADSAQGLSETRSETGLRMPDAVVLRLGSELGRLSTWDARLAASARAQGVAVVS